MCGRSEPARSSICGVRPLQLIVSLTPSGWQVIDAEWRLPASWYATLEEARREASNYLAMHGGGQLVVRERTTTLDVIDIQATRPEAA